MSRGRRLIVNADDFGLSSCVNRGIILAHECGMVTSASLMVRQDAAEDAAQSARAHPALSLGLHLDLGEWKLVGDSWEPVYEVIPLDDAGRIEIEVRQQVHQFRALLGTDPTHIDSHQHVHRREPVRTIVRKVASGLRVPVRHEDAAIRYAGWFYGQDENGRRNSETIGVDSLIEGLAGLPPGITELCCHPAEIGGCEDTVTTMYWEERGIELSTLCDSRLSAAIARLGIDLRSFSQLRDAADPGMAVSSPDGSRDT